MNLQKFVCTKKILLKSSESDFWRIPTEKLDDFGIPTSIYIVLQTVSYYKLHFRSKYHTVATNELLCLKNAGAQISLFFTSYEWSAPMAIRAWVSTGAKGAWHPLNFWTVMSGTRWFWQFYYIMLCFTLKFWGFTSDWHPLFQIPNSSPDQGQLQEWTEHCLTAVLKIWNQ